MCPFKHSTSKDAVNKIILNEDCDVQATNFFAGKELLTVSTMALCFHRKLCMFGSDVKALNSAWSHETAQPPT